MGGRCTQARFLEGKPNKVRSTSSSVLCDRCIQEGYTPEDIPASRSESEPKPMKLCRSCGSKEPEAGIKSLGDFIPLCVSCVSAWRSGVEPGFQFPTTEKPPTMAEAAAKFDELFRAARMLLKECAKKNEEDRIIPTLALANHLCDEVPRLVREKERLVRVWDDARTWDEEADRFARRFGGLRPVGVVNEVLILERRPVLVTINYLPVRKTPQDVTISVYPHRTPLAEAGDVASLYNKTLSEAGIAHDERRTGGWNFNFHNRRLEIWISPGTVIERTTVAEGFTVPQPGWRIDKATFPHPHLVGELYKTLRDEFARDLATRERGATPKTKHLVPACVAFFLREYGIRPRRKIHRLLNDHGLWQSGETYSDGAISQLWENVNNESLVRSPLVDSSWTLFYEGHEYNE